MLNSQDRVHALEIASKLLDDLELGDVKLDRVILRTSRLARLVGDEEVIEWLRWEQQGFPEGGESELWRRRTGRVFRDESENVYVGAFRLVSMVTTLQAELARMQLPALSGDGIVTATNNVIKYASQVRNIVTKNNAILASVEAQIHSFAVRTFYALRIATSQDSMFEGAKLRIDDLLRGLDQDFLRRIDSAYSSLEAGDTEAISAAMNSVRRVIDAFADAVFPATIEGRTDGQGRPIRLGDAQRLNRIKAFIDDNSGGSQSRANRLKRAISDVYDRVSAGVHSDVTASEARSLFLFSYTLLGEILELPRQAEEEATDVTLE